MPDYEAFLAEVLAEVPEDQRPAIEGVLKTNKKLKDGALRQSDYSRQMDALRTAQTELQGKTERWEEWYATASQEHATAAEKLAAYETEFGPLETDGHNRPTRRPALDEEALAKELARRDHLAIKFADVLTDLKIEHKEKFKERLDTDALLELAGKRGLPIDAAYRELVSDKVEALREADVEARIAKAREEAERAALSRHNLPIAAGPNEIHTLDRTDVKTDPRERVRAAVDAFNSRQR